MSLHGRDLDDDTENHDDSADNNCSPSSNPIAKGQDEDGTKEATYTISAEPAAHVKMLPHTNFIDGSHEALPCRVALCLWEVIVEWVSRDDSRHNAL